MRCPLCPNTNMLSHSNVRGEDLRLNVKGVAQTTVEDAQTASAGSLGCINLLEDTQPCFVNVIV